MMSHRQDKYPMFTEKVHDKTIKPVFRAYITGGFLLDMISLFESTKVTEDTKMVFDATVSGSYHDGGPRDSNGRLGCGRYFLQLQTLFGVDQVLWRGPGTLH